MGYNRNNISQVNENIATNRFDPHFHMYSAKPKSKLMTTECQEHTLLTTFQLHVKEPYYGIGL